MDERLQQAQKEMEAAQAALGGDIKELLASSPRTAHTMAGVEWNHGKHHLSGADCEGEPAVMISPCGGDGMSRNIALISLDDGFFLEETDKYVVPNGKRYRLVEALDHPEVLATEEDYQNAPAGTIVAAYAMGSHPFCKEGKAWFASGNPNGLSSEMMSRATGRILRWGGEA